MGLRLSLNDSKPVWVKYEAFDKDGNKIAEAEFLISALSATEANKISRQSVVRIKKPIIKNGRKKLEMVEEFDSAKFLGLMFDKIVIDWKGLEDENGNPIPCTTENKYIIADKYPDIANFCIDEATGIEKTLSRKKEEQVKN